MIAEVEHRNGFPISLTLYPRLQFDFTKRPLLDRGQRTWSMPITGLSMCFEWFCLPWAATVFILGPRSWSGCPDRGRTIITGLVERELPADGVIYHRADGRTCSADVSSQVWHLYVPPRAWTIHRGSSWKRLCMVGIFCLILIWLTWEKVEIWLILERENC